MKSSIQQFAVASSFAIAVFLIAIIYPQQGYSERRINNTHNLKLPIKARVEVVLPIGHRQIWRNKTILFPVLKRVFSNVELRGRIKNPHFSLYIRFEKEKKGTLAHATAYLKLNTGSGDIVSKFVTSASANSNWSGLKKAYSKAFAKAYHQFVNELVANKKFVKLVRNGVSNSIARKVDDNNSDQVSSQYKDMNDAVATLKVLSAKTSRSGSGFFINSNGLMLTNYHVIKKARSIKVRLTNKKVLPAVVVASDAWMDIALIKVKTSGNKYIPLDLGFNAYKIGDELIAIGSPLSTQETISKGILSSVKSIGGYRVIQTDAAINSGNSGGPLIHLKSRKVIGVNTLKKATGIAYAMSLRTIRNFMKENKKTVALNKNRIYVLLKQVSFAKNNKAGAIGGEIAGSKFGVAVYSSGGQSVESQISEVIENKLIKASQSGEILVRVLGSQARKYMYEGSKYKRSKKLCLKYGLDGFVIFSLDGASGSFGSDEVEIAFYDCKANRKFSRQYDVRQTGTGENRYGNQIVGVVSNLLKKLSTRN